MLKILTGEHTFLRQQAFEDLKKDLGDCRVVTTEDLTAGGLEDLLLSHSLFEPSQNFIFYQLSANQSAWAKLVELAEQIAAADDLVVILIEDKLDRRTQFSKLAAKHGWETRFDLPRDYDRMAATRFIAEQAKLQSLTLTPALAQLIFELVGPNPWDQFQAVSKLAPLEKVTAEIIKTYIPKNQFGNVFEIIELALQGRLADLEREISQLETEAVEPHQFFGLLVSQLTNMAIVKTTPDDVDVAREFGIHPFAVRKMVGLLGSLSLARLNQALTILVETDQAMKTSGGDAWELIRIGLVKISQLTD